MRKLAMVVEDESCVRRFISHVLSLSDFDVLEADTEEDAYSLFQEHSSEICYIFSDLNLRKGNGVSLYQKIRSQSEDVRIVLSSGMPDLDIALISEDEHCVFLSKPFSIDLLTDTF
jgi:two-component system, cell cycle sensor histidine kinase and response regulator CckA